MTPRRASAPLLLALALGAPGSVRPAAAWQAPTQAPVAAPAPMPADTGSVPAGARPQPGVPFDPVTATRAYLATVPAAERARSDAYFEGGYWIEFWDVLITAGVCLLLLGYGWSRAMRARAERIGRWPALGTWLYWVQFLTVFTLLTLPWSIYTGWVRERQYGLANQDFAHWLLDQAKAYALALVLGGLAIVLVYAVIRRTGRRWVAWASLVAVLLLTVSLVLGPVFITPIFNKVQRLTDARIRDPIVQLAAANGVQARDIYVIDASRQSKRISANVSGFLGTERVTLNDNLLHRATLPEIRAVMAHELGHYVLHHVWYLLLFLSVLFTLGLFAVRWAFERLQRRHGAAWGTRDIADPAALPLVFALLSVFFFVLGPVSRTATRTTEDAADIFGLNAAREPDGFAQVALKLREYRKLDPTPVEEALFYDHPSGRARILMAMRWKAAHLGEPLPK